MHRSGIPWRVVLAVLLIIASRGQLEAKVTKQMKPALEPFDLKNVRLLAGPCKDAQEANRRYLHELDEDRLLHNFRLNAGLPAPGEPLGGWERPDSEVRGHFTGHYLSACALMYASTGDTRLRDKARRMVGELAKCQKALGGGYLSAFPEDFWDRLEQMEKPPWAPFYTIHKIMAGLLDVYSLCGDQKALDVLKKMAGYFSKRLDRLSDHHMDRILTVEFGGMSEVLHNLYAVTGDPDHLKLAHRFDWAAFLGPLALEHDNLSNIHGNMHIPVAYGAARHYELTGDARHRTAAAYFWDRVVNTRTYATGGSTMREHWFEPNKLAATLARDNQECCKTHNMLKLTRYLIRWTAEADYADYYERAFFNGILGTQEPDTGMLMYYVPLATGFIKTFGTPNDSFWCCYGTGIESFAKLGDSIYFHDENGVYVNLFIPSTLRWPEKGVRIEQKTRFPEEDTTELTVRTQRPVNMTLAVRVPYWAKRGAQFSVNGRKLAVKTRPSSYTKIKRTWNDGDRVRVVLPMSLHAHPMPDDPQLAALMHGPLVLAGIVDQGPANPPRAGSNQYEAIQTIEPPKEAVQGFVGDLKKLDSWIKPVPGKPLTFRTVGQPKDITLIPLNRILREHYGVYWVITRNG